MTETGKLMGLALDSDALDLRMAHDRRDLVGDLEELRRSGHCTARTSIDGVPHYTGAFWTSRQRQAHRIHEISYRACFKPQLPAFFIARLTDEGDIVHDPFMGRGTTPIEAALRGRIPYGNDINPLCRMLTEPRVHAPDMHDIGIRLRDIPWEDFRHVEFEHLLVFYHRETLARIEGLRSWMLNRDACGKLDEIDRWIWMVAMNRLTGHSTGFFSVRTMPPNQAVGIEQQRKINQRSGRVPPWRDVPGIVEKKSRTLLSQGRPQAHRSLFLTGKPDQTSCIENESVALTVTSPPFLDTVNYEADNWLRCWLAGIDPKSVDISGHRHVRDWQEFTVDTLRELSRITRRGGHVAYEVGEVRKGKVQLEEYVVMAARRTDLDVLCVMINRQQFTKTSNCWGITNNSGGTNSNRIVVMKKPERWRET